jgi:hypothetical protein
LIVNIIEITHYQSIPMPSILICWFLSGWKILLSTTAAPHIPRVQYLCTSGTVSMEKNWDSSRNNISLPSWFNRRHYTIFLECSHLYFLDHKFLTFFFGELKYIIIHASALTLLLQKKKSKKKRRRKDDGT